MDNRANGLSRTINNNHIKLGNIFMSYFDKYLKHGEKTSTWNISPNLRPSWIIAPIPRPERKFTNNFIKETSSILSATYLF